MIRNFTPHDIVIVRQAGNLILKSEGIARISQETQVADSMDGIPLSVSRFGEAVGLPEPEEGTMLIVSQMVFSALPKRMDLLVPTDMVRDDTGRILGCRSLGMKIPDYVIR